ncbi:hypothetical protein WN944_000125 [Citrus x changshan-huyou]|uniref:Peptidase A1 domain-containing protein n=1 Tax=Citrus x changshan-huyou TaxID=2935761 RepID=A0AAP0QTI1_9ROSI
MGSLKFILSAYLLSLSLCYAFEERVTAESQHELQHMHTIQLSSLLPSSVCNPSTKGNAKKSSLKVVHKHGPCFKPYGNGEKAASPSPSVSHAEILRQDQSRVKSIHSRLSKNSGSLDEIGQTDDATLPAKDGSVVGAGNYIVTVGIGTPKKDLSLIFDTGSDLTWTQCEPCVKYCYEQKEPKFDPTVSQSYSNVSCSSTICTSLQSATGNSPSCASSTCLYGIQYGDSSFSIGFFGKETLTLTPTDVFPNFLFGCGQNNRGLFGGAAGLMGLGRDPISLVSQTATKYKKLFSYCLPSSASSTGHLTFGPGASKSVQFTPLSSISGGSSFYGLEMIGISVGGQKISIAASVFTKAGTIIDSGTVITRLPPDAYTPLRTAFRQFMSKYPTAPALSLLDTCYDFSKYSTVTLPKISLFFSGGVEVSVDKTGIMYASNISQVCLAFAGNSDPTDVGIFGNTQQHTLEVVYDVAGGKVGFAAGGCS